jgi:hypothetical protein
MLSRVDRFLSAKLDASRFDDLGLAPTISEARVTAERAEMPWISPSVGAGRVSRFIDPGYWYPCALIMIGWRPEERRGLACH